LNMEVRTEGVEKRSLCHVSESEGETNFVSLTRVKKGKQTKTQAAGRICHIVSKEWTNTRVPLFPRKGGR